jgi:hypothetical protein
MDNGLDVWEVATEPVCQNFLKKTSATAEIRYQDSRPVSNPKFIVRIRQIKKSNSDVRILTLDFVKYWRY